LLASRHDLLTVNEIFCRRDYGRGPYRTVIDIGANIGLASLYFLTRAEEVRVWAVEPDPSNVAQLRSNLAAFEGRYVVHQAAVVAEPATSVRFSFAGRYGHVSDDSEPGAVVPALDIATLIREIAAERGRIDLVKIDTEGSESALVAAIPSDVDVAAVVYEDNHGHTRWRRSTPRR
jgi:FkbM family methyltransferase